MLEVLIFSLLAGTFGYSLGSIQERENSNTPKAEGEKKPTSSSSYHDGFLNGYEHGIDRATKQLKKEQKNDKK